MENTQTSAHQIKFKKTPSVQEPFSNRSHLIATTIFHEILSSALSHHE